MALPTLDKTWLFYVNNATVGSVDLSGSEQSKQILIDIKDILTASLLPEHRWIVAGSCDSLTAGMDGVDRWEEPEDLVVGNSSPFSWLVLRQPGTGLELCLSYPAYFSGSGNAMYTLNAHVSWSSGFSGGSTTARPTAADEVELLDGENIWYTNSSVETHNIHVLQSNDGLFTYVLLTGKDRLHSIWFFGAPLDVPSAWENPLVASLDTAFTFDCWFTLFNNRIIKGNVPGTSNKDLGGCTEMVYCTHPSGPWVPLAVQQDGASPFTGCWPMQPIGLFSDGLGCEVGRLPDVWVTSSSPDVVNYMPASATKRFVAIDTLVFPWNGGVMNTGEDDF